MQSGQLSAHTCTLFLIVWWLGVNYKPNFKVDQLFMSELSNAKIHFNEQGTPVASDFDDVYFSNDGGMAETDYVFLQQNGLPDRWSAHSAAAFHIIETGFGTGANFLLSWQRFRQFRAANPAATCQRLYFSSFEKFPLSYNDLQQALAVHSELTDVCQLLLAHYPLPVSGCHRLCFDNGSVILDLWLGDVNALLPELTAAADAIYLDGFAPSKNPDMWQEELFTGLARLSKDGTTVATFTSAGIVKRGLQQAGFAIKKVKGFGRKREMLIARFEAANPVHSNDLPKEVCIVGGGIASLCLALNLIQRNIPVQLICEDDSVAQQASQNRQGAVYPNLHANQTPESQLHVLAFFYARQFYQRWQTQGLDFAMQWCGLLHLASNEQLSLRQQKLIGKALWPTHLVKAVAADEASTLAGLVLEHKGIFFPQAGWLSPKQFCQQALQFLLQQRNFRVSFNTRVTSLVRQSTGWLLHTDKGDICTDSVVLATGKAINSFNQTQFLPLNKIRGQVTHIAQPAMTELKTVLCHKGYITPAWQGVHCVGATFDRDADAADVKSEDDAENLQLVNDQLSEPAWFADTKVVGAAAAFRATLPDHLPLAGAVPNEPNLFLLGAMGARGILLSPLLAEQLACQICQEPLPLSQQLISKLLPVRFEGVR